MSTPAWVFEQITKIAYFLDNYVEWTTLADVRGADNPAAPLLGQYSYQGNGYDPQGDIQNTVNTGDSVTPAVVTFTGGINTNSNLTLRVRTADAGAQVIDDWVISDTVQRAVTPAQQAQGLINEVMAGITGGFESIMPTSIVNANQEAQFLVVGGNAAGIASIAFSQFVFTPGDPVPGGLGPI